MRGIEASDGKRIPFQETEIKTYRIKIKRPEIHPAVFLWVFLTYGLSPTLGLRSPRSAVSSAALGDSYTAAAECKRKDRRERTGIDAQRKLLIAALSATTENDKQNKQNHPGTVTLSFRTGTVVEVEHKHLLRG